MVGGRGWAFFGRVWKQGSERYLEPWGQRQADKKDHHVEADVNKDKLLRWRQGLPEWIDRREVENQDGKDRG